MFLWDKNVTRRPATPAYFAPSHSSKGAFLEENVFFSKCSFSSSYFLIFTQKNLTDKMETHF